jgi:hypothetical protein
MEDKVIKKTNEYIENIVNEELNSNNLEYLDKLVDIQKDVYKIKCMKEEDKMYGNYSGRRPGHGSYGEYGNYGEYSGYNNYGRRGYDSKYRGHDKINEMDNEYGRYMESREYGAGEDTKRSLHYMLKSMEDFARMLKEEAQSQEEVEMIRQTAQRIAQM